MYSFVAADVGKSSPRTAVRLHNRRFSDSQNTTHTILATFTALQGQYLAFIVAYTKVNGRAPAEADFERYFRVTPPSVHDMILTLERRGSISRIPGKPRSIEVLVPREQVPPLD